ncbi:MAG: hypothetical protein HUU38_00300 [Anaerolineales bacterium]|nr:hypothetical protein [Anaerolineales bacterium]
MENTSPPVIKFLPASILLGGLGLAGLGWLLIYTLPTVGPRWLFFLCWFLLLTGVSLPVMAFLNRRFPSEAPATQAVIIRQATWIGLYGCILAWLQIGRVVTFPLALWIAAGLGLVEWLLRLRERGAWRP